MTNNISFSIKFDKFQNSKTIQLKPGFYVVYGESGSGKSHFVQALANLESLFPAFDRLGPKSIPFPLTT